MRQTLVTTLMLLLVREERLTRLVFRLIAGY